MEQILFGNVIKENRKRLNLTQEDLAQKLGVTNQAVSKWESDQSCPDIMIIPELAGVFGISIDELFGKEPPVKAPVEEPPLGILKSLPWKDDNDLHAVLYKGHKMLRQRLIHVYGTEVSDALKGFEFRFQGSCDNIDSDFNVTVDPGSVIGGSVHAGDSVVCGNIKGNVTAGEEVRCGNVGGSVHAGDGVQAGDVDGTVHAGDEVNCGNVGRDVRAGGNVTASEIGGKIIAGGKVTVNRA